MRLHRPSAKITAGALTVCGVLAIGALAAAYFTSSGAGSGHVTNASGTTASVSVTSPGPVVVGQSVTLSAIATDNFGGTTNVSTSATYTMASATCTINVCTPTAVGSQAVSATYATKTGVTTQTVNQAATATALISTTGSPTVVGQSVVFTATVTPQYTGTPGGYVEFFSSGVAIAACNGTSGEPLSGANATCTIVPSSTGTLAITASYSGSTNYASSPSSSINQVVNQASTSTALSVSPTSSVYGAENSEVFTVAVTPQYTLTPTGTVTVKSGALTLCTLTLPATTCDPGVVAEPYSASPYSVTAVYNATTNFASSTSSAQTFSVTKDTSSSVVSETPISEVYGNEQATTFSIVVTTGHGEVLPSTDPTTINVGGASCSANVIPGGSGGTGTCTLTSTALSVSGPNTTSSTYPGDADVLPASLSTSATGFSVTQATTSTSLSVTTPTTAYGNEQATVFTVGVTPQYAGTPTGTISVKTGATTICTITLPATACSATSETLLAYSASTYPVTAVYNATTNFASSTSSASNITINKDTSSAVVSETPTSEAYGNEQATTFSIVVTTGHGEVLPSTDPTTINVGGASCSANVIPGGSGGTGTCTIGATALAYQAGAYTTSSTYPGDADVTRAALATAATGFSVTKDTSSSVVSETPISEVYGNEQATTFSIVVTTGHGEVLPSTDPTTINVGGASCSANVIPGGSGGTGTCTLTSTALSVSGPNTTSSTYPGDADVLPASLSTSATGFSVTQATTSTSLALSSANASVGSENSEVFTVGVTPQYAGTPTGTVSVYAGGTGGTLLCSVTLPATTCSPTASALAASGTPYSITAVYTTTSNFATSTSSAQSLTVSAAPNITSVTQYTCTTRTCTSTASLPTSTNNYLVLVYESGASAPPTVTVTTGHNTPFASCGTPTMGVVKSATSYVVMVPCVGSGKRPHTMTVTIGSTAPTSVTIQALDLGSATASVVVPSGNAGSGTTTPATATLGTATSGDAEITLLGITGINGSTVTPPAGMTRLGTQEAGTSYTTDAYLDDQAVTSASFAFTGGTTNWGTVSVEISP